MLKYNFVEADLMRYFSSRKVPYFHNSMGRYRINLVPTHNKIESYLTKNPGETPGQFLFNRNNLLLINSINSFIATPHPLFFRLHSFRGRLKITIRE